MAGSAPYQYDVPLTAGSTLEHSVAWDMDDGSPFPWADYTIAYAVSPDGRSCGSLGGSASVNLDLGLVTFACPALSPATYRHSCRITHIATGKTLPVFDGRLIVAGSA